MAGLPSTDSSSTLEGAATDVDKELHFQPIRRPSNAARRGSTASRASRRGSISARSQKETYDPNLDVNLPYRTLSRDANFDEYRVTSHTGTIPGPIEPPSVAGPGNEKRYQLVTFTPDDPENPKNWSKAYKWYCTMVVALTCFVVAFCSAVITADLVGPAEEFHVSLEVAFLTISVFVIGFGVGPMAFAPLSEVFGRRVI